MNQVCECRSHQEGKYRKDGGKRGYKLKQQRDDECYQMAKASESHDVILKILPFLFLSCFGEKCVFDG